MTLERTNQKLTEQNENTLQYYDENAAKFVASTKSVEFRFAQDKFLSYLPESSYILDFGCGSGRDSKYFLERGHRVDAVDGSKEICKIAREYVGIEVKQMLFSELSFVNKYEGIWACSSILHLPKTELRDVLYKMVRAIKPNGYIYTSFKYGDYEGYREERYFTDFTENSFKAFIKDFSEIRIVEYWISKDVRPGRSEEKWLNLILQKSDIV